MYDGGKSHNLVVWAKNEVEEGRDPTKVKEQACDIGTIAHFMVECKLRDQKHDLTDFSPNDIEKAQTAYQAYLDWENQFKSFEVIAIEQQLVSIKYNYGGTLDLLAKINDVLFYIDFKTSKGIYPSHKMQSSSYKSLWEEHYPDQPIGGIIVLKIDKRNGNFTDVKLTNEEIEVGFEMFLCCHDLYWYKKELGW